jgi:hypothetical protein
VAKVERPVVADREVEHVVEIGAGGDQPRDGDVVEAVLVADDQHAHGPPEEVSRQFPSGQPGDHPRGEGALADPLVADDQVQVADEEPVLPRPPKRPYPRGVRGADLQSPLGCSYQRVHLSGI